MILRSPAEEIADYWEWFELADSRGWTDGLPLAPPTEERALAILQYLRRGPDEVVGAIPPRMGVATFEQVAIQCAMAGCRPEHVPVVAAAVEAMLEPSFNLHGVQTTSNPCAPLVVVSGPAVQRLGFNAGEGCFGGGSRANAALGRAVRLILRNIGGAVAGETDLATLGMPGTYAFCVAENSEMSPWTPIHVDHGQPPGRSCVTVFACSSPHPIFVPGNAERILRVLATTLPTTGVNMFHAAGQFMVAFGVRPARELAGSGYDKQAVKRWIFENARYDLGQLRRSGVMAAGEAFSDYWGSAVDGPNVPDLPDSAQLPMVHSPDDIHVIVAGGPSQWWLGFLPGWGDYGGQAITRPISFPDGAD